MFGLICCHNNPIVKEYLSLFGGKIQKMDNIGLILASNVKYQLKSEINPWNLSPEAKFNQIGPGKKNSEIPGDMKA